MLFYVKVVYEVKTKAAVESAVAALHWVSLPLFLPPPQPPLQCTGPSLKEMRSFLGGADVDRLADGTSLPEKD